MTFKHSGGEGQGTQRSWSNKTYGRSAVECVTRDKRRGHRVCGALAICIFVGIEANYTCRILVYPAEKEQKNPHNHTRLCFLYFHSLTCATLPSLDACLRRRRSLAASPLQISGEHSISNEKVGPTLQPPDIVCVTVSACLFTADGGAMYCSHTFGQFSGIT